MDVLTRFRVGFQALADSPMGAAELLPSRLTAASCTALPGVCAAGVSLFSDLLRVAIGASDSDAALAQQLQFTVGDGPCFAAHETNRVVLAGGEELTARWPVFAEQLTARTPFRSIVSMPLTAGLTGLGTLDLYSPERPDLAGVVVSEALRVAAQISVQLTAEPLIVGEAGVLGPPWLFGPASRARFLVPIALGMLTSRAEIGFADALAVLQAHAFAEGRTLDELAEGIVDRSVPIEEIYGER